MSRETLRPEHLKARLIRALSGLTQDQMGEETGLASSLIDQFEQGKVLPGEDHLEEMARCTGFEAADAGELLVHFRTQSQTWLRPSESAGSILDHLVRRLRRHSVHAVQRLLKLSPPEPGDRGHADQQLAKLKRLSYRSRLAVVRSVEEYQSQALAERCREEARRQAAVSSKRTKAWARLAAEIAGLA